VNPGTTEITKPLSYRAVQDDRKHRRTVARKVVVRTTLALVNGVATVLAVRMSRDCCLLSRNVYGQIGSFFRCLAILSAVVAFSCACYAYGLLRSALAAPEE
jgi:hypothetical protein